MASTYLTNTNPTAGNRTKGTISVWFKRANISSDQYLYTERYDNNNRAFIQLKSNDQLNFQSLDGGNTQVQIQTNRVFRDTNAWYHLVAAWDTTDSTVADRVKIYINGVRETSFAVNSPPNSSINLYFGVGSSSYPIVIGRRGDSADYFDGLMSHFHRVDNQQLAQTVFGSTDSTTGEWKINTSPSITYTGSSSFNFFILKDGNSVTDQSGESNNLTVGGGTLSNYVDNPSHVFNTMDSKNKSSVVDVRRCGNTTVGTSNSSSGSARSNWNIPATGKWYFEYKMIPDNQGNTYPNSGIKYNAENYYNPNSSDADADIFVYGTYGSVLLYVRNGTNITAGAPASSGDIFGFAIDQDNGAIYVHENGTYMSQGGNVGVPTSGGSKTGAVFTYTAGAYPNMCLVGKEFGNSETQWNFGNGIFFTSPIASEGSNASGIGKFEFDVPNGYTALSTKGLNE